MGARARSGSEPVSEPGEREREREPQEDRTRGKQQELCTGYSIAPSCRRVSLAMLSLESDRHRMGWVGPPGCPSRRTSRAGTKTRPVCRKLLARWMSMNDDNESAIEA